MLQTKSMLSCNSLQHPILSQRRLHNIMRMTWYCTHIPIMHLTLANRKAAPSLLCRTSTRHNSKHRPQLTRSKIVSYAAKPNSARGLFVENMREFTTLHIILFLYTTSSVILNLLHQYKALVFSHDTVKTKHSKAFDMRYHLVRDRVQQQAQFYIY